MQNLFDFIAANTAVFIGLLVFVVFTIGFVLALRTQSGRDALGMAAVRFAVAALAMAEKWLDQQIAGWRLAALEGHPRPLHPIVQAQTELQSWISRQT